MLESPKQMARPDQWVQIGQLKIDPRLFGKSPFGRCRAGECKAACCYFGVSVDLADASRIVEEAETIKPHLPPDRRNVTDWFGKDVEEDPDFPSGLGVRTQVVESAKSPDDQRCVFLLPDNRCGIQVASVARGHSPWDLKPFYCGLYPLILTKGALYLDDDSELYKKGGTCQIASPVAIPTYVLFKDELVHALGQDGYDQMVAIARRRAEGDR